MNLLSRRLLHCWMLLGLWRALFDLVDIHFFRDLFREVRELLSSTDTPDDEAAAE